MSASIEKAKQYCREHLWARIAVTALVLATFPLWIIPFMLGLLLLLIGMLAHDAIWGDHRGQKWL